MEMFGGYNINPTVPIYRNSILITSIENNSLFKSIRKTVSDKLVTTTAFGQTISAEYCGVLVGLLDADEVVDNNTVQSKLSSGRDHGTFQTINSVAIIRKNIFG